MLSAVLEIIVLYYWKFGQTIDLIFFQVFEEPTKLFSQSQVSSSSQGLQMEAEAEVCQSKNDQGTQEKETAPSPLHRGQRVRGGHSSLSWFCLTHASHYPPIVILPSPLLPIPPHEQVPTAMVGGAAAMIILPLSSILAYLSLFSSPWWLSLSAFSLSSPLPVVQFN